MIYMWGKVFTFDLGTDPNHGSEQQGIRPCVIVSNNVGNKFGPILQVAPITKLIHKANRKLLPTHVVINRRSFVRSDKGVNYDSVILGEQITSVDKKRLKNGDPIGSYIGELTLLCKVQLAIAVLKSHGLYEIVEALTKGMGPEQRMKILMSVIQEVTSVA